MKTARLQEHYHTNVIPNLMKRWSLNNPFQVPKLVKIIINIGLSEAKDNIKVIDIADAELKAITGQKPMLCRAKKSISNFKIRQNMPIGLKVTLRGARMYEFFDRLISIAIPRVKDFRGLNPRSFDGHGNYNLGLDEQYIFPEVNIEKSDKARGMNITIVTSAENNDQSRDLLAEFGMPFKKS
ncbi:MAG: 50S ribosomal protein L5 [Elusimicrobia bacterium]|nr:50S ribosomal protein L5 [Elusimicrobiota bacterium]MBD3412088.1 50S ribosomal protein L5 [Elusimicrobiota bacterium]